MKGWHGCAWQCCCRRVGDAGSGRGGEGAEASSSQAGFLRSSSGVAGEFARVWKYNDGAQLHWREWCRLVPIVQCRHCDLGWRRVPAGNDQEGVGRE